MRILVLNYEFPPLGGGAGNVTAQITRHLVRRGAEVVVLTSHFRGLPRKERKDGYLIYRVPAMRRRLDRCSIPEMGAYIAAATGPALRLAESFRPDLMHVYFGMPTGPVALVVRLLKGIPYLLSLQGGDVPGFLGNELALVHGVTRPITRQVWSHASEVIVNSQGLHERALRTMPDKEIKIIPNGVDLDLYQSSQNERDSDSPVRILFVGRFANQKGLSYLLRSLANLSPEVLARIQVELVGDGPEEASLKALTNELGLIRAVHFPGWLPRQEVVRKYQEADMFVLPSIDEGMPLVLLEAMSSGKPVIATDISGNRELVETGANGYLVPPKDPTALGHALSRLIANPDLRCQMGQRSRVLASRYDWSRIADEYLSLSEQIVETSKTRVAAKRKTSAVR